MDYSLILYVICAFLQWTYWIAKAWEKRADDDEKFFICAFGWAVSLLWPIFLTINAWRMTIRNFP